MQHYYDYTKSDSSLLMDNILKATIECIDADFKSDFNAELPILEFFREINITSLSDEKFKTAFLEE